LFVIAFLVPGCFSVLKGENSPKKAHLFLALVLIWPPRRNQPTTSRSEGGGVVCF
jgi:hypothetical protein